MIAVPDRGVAAARTVLVRVVMMDLVLAVGHGPLLSLLRTQCFSLACATAFSTSVRTWSSAML
jgi:hypothetical protein